MAFKQFPRDRFVKIFATDEIVRVGSFSNVSGELAHIRSEIYIKGTLGGNEKMRLKVYSDARYTALFATSEWFDLIKIEDEDGNVVGGDYIGDVRFDFNRQNINPNITYYVAAEIVDYTENYDSFFVAISRDYINSVYSVAGNKYSNHPFKMQIFTYKQ